MQPRGSSQDVRVRGPWSSRTAVVVVAVLCALALVPSGTASAALAVTVVNTDGQGVASRSAPSLGATNGYGAPANASVVATCWTWGDAVGPYVNRLWWLVSYAGRQFYVADRYLSTPNAANQPPADQPQCGSSTPPSTGGGSNSGDPSVWVGSPVQGRWSTFEGAKTHHLLSKVSPTNDFAIDLESSSGQNVVLYAAPQNSAVSITARVDTVLNGACRLGGGGSFVTIGFYTSNGTRIGSATYAHIDPVVAQGATVNRWGTVIGRVGSYAYDVNCWTGPHVHFEMYSTRNYACYNGTYALGAAINPPNFVGYTGGDRAKAARTACP